MAAPNDSLKLLIHGLDDRGIYARFQSSERRFVRLTARSKPTPGLSLLPKRIGVSLTRGSIGKVCTPPPSDVPRDFGRGGGSTNSVEDREQRERGSGGGSPPSQGFWRQL